MGFVGAVVEPIDGERSRLFGATFSLFDGEHFITPDHVVTWALEHEAAEALYVLGAGLEPVRVEDVFRHPSADLAVLRAPHGSDVEPFASLATPVRGTEVTLSAWRGISAGSGLATVATTVTGRVVVRPPRRPSGTYEFEAFELADAFGKGFSGSPVVDARGRVLGMHTQTLADLRGARGIALALDAPEVRLWIERAMSVEQVAA